MEVPFRERSVVALMQQRYYDPGIGRFLSVDPVAARPMGDNFNRYWYANNNPYKFTDPDGRDVTCYQSSCTINSHSILEMVVDYGTVGIIYTRRMIENALTPVSTAPMRNESQEGSTTPPPPGTLVGTQDGGSRQQGGRVNNGPLAPAHGGTDDAGSDFDHLTGGNSAPAPEGSRLPPGSVVGENGVIFRPGSGSTGPRIDIPASGDKPHETLHYPVPPPPPKENEQ